MSGSDWIVGYATAAGSPDSGTWRDTRLGGFPIWPPGSYPEISNCPQCNRERILLLQAYAPHVAHSERVLLVFVCNSAVCSRKAENWIALRAFRRKDVGASRTVQKASSSNNVYNSATINWNSDSNGSDSDASKENDDLESLLMLQNLTISNSDVAPKSTRKDEVHITGESDVNCKSTQVDGLSKPQLFLKPHFIEVAVEPKQKASSIKSDDKVKKLLDIYEEEQARLQQSGEDTQWDREVDIEETEETQAVDSFREALERAPEHVLRYKFAGDPVWPAYPPPEAQRITCEHCGSRQVFEVQVLGSALFFLDGERAVPSSQDEAAFNFMTMAIYTCEKDCEKGDYKSEGIEFEYRSQEVRVQTDVW